MVTFLCENCGVTSNIRLVDNTNEEVVLFCPVCGDEFYEYDEVDIQEELDFDDE